LSTPAIAAHPTSDANATLASGTRGRERDTFTDYSDKPPGGGSYGRASRARRRAIG
jgi:hypothetical protein